MTDARWKLIDRIGKLAALAAAAPASESSSAMDKIYDLVTHYDIGFDDLPSSTRLQLDEIAGSLFLSMAGVYTVSAASLGGRPGLWLVTGRGELPREEMMAVAQARGWKPRWFNTGRAA